MSKEQLFISVPRSCLTEFYSKYLNLVETFYYVTLSETKSGDTSEKPEFVYFIVTFNLNPVDSNLNPRDLVDRIQVHNILTFNPKAKALGILHNNIDPSMKRAMSGAPWFIWNDEIHRYSDMPTIKEEVIKYSIKYKFD